MLYCNSYCTTWCNIRYDLIWFQTCLNLSKLVQTCPKLQYDKILLNLMQFDTIDMSRLVIMLWYDLIRFYKHVQTCHNAMIWFDTILQTCLNLSKKMTKYIKIHLKFLRNVFFPDDKAIPWTASTSERSKSAILNHFVTLQKVKRWNRYKQKVQPSKSLCSNGFVVNTL